MAGGGEDSTSSIATSFGIVVDSLGAIPFVAPKVNGLDEVKSPGDDVPKEKLPVVFDASNLNVLDGG